MAKVKPYELNFVYYSSFLRPDNCLFVYRLGVAVSGVHKGQKLVCDNQTEKRLESHY